MKKIVTFPPKLNSLKTESKWPLFAKTISGLEPVLAKELESLGAADVKVVKRAVSFTGDLALMLKANYCCRTALRILKPLFEFTITDQKDLYVNLNGYPWEDLLTPDSTISIDAVISYTVFTNSQFVAQKSKDAIVDRFRDKFGQRPNVDLENPDLRINVHLFKDLCSVSLDSSGQSLHKRGYRRSTGAAPINEVLAAGLVQLSGWDLTTPVYDPMCGSGTLIIEAAMLAKNIPCGYFRKEFGFMRWRDFDETLWNSVKTEADARISPLTLQFFGSDRTEMAISSTKENLAFTGLTNDVSLQVISFEESTPPVEKGFILCNPPYDERLRVDDTIAFNKMIGDTLKRKYKGYTAWFISSDLESIKFIGLKPSRKIVVFNGPLECRFVKFELY